MGEGVAHDLCIEPDLKVEHANVIVAKTAYCLQMCGTRRVVASRDEASAGDHESRDGPEAGEPDRRGIAELRQHNR